MENVITIKYKFNKFENRDSFSKNTNYQDLINNLGDKHLGDKHLGDKHLGDVLFDLYNNHHPNDTITLDEYVIAVYLPMPLEVVDEKIKRFRRGSNSLELFITDSNLYKANFNEICYCDMISTQFKKYIRTIFDSYTILNELNNPFILDRKYVGILNGIYKPLQIVCVFIPLNNNVIKGISNVTDHEKTAIFNDLKNKLTPPSETTPNIIELPCNDYFLFLYIFLILDVLHDFRKGFRNTNNKICSTFSKKKLTYFTTNIKNYLKYQKNKLLEEYKSVDDGLKGDDNNFIKSDKLIEFFDRLFISGANLEKSVYDTILHEIMKQQKQKQKQPDAINESLKIYNEIKTELQEKKILNNERHYISNNASGFKHDENSYYMKEENDEISYYMKEENDENNYFIEDDINILFKGTIKNNFKSIPASLYDGAPTTGPGGNIYNSFMNKGIEYGSYNIKFKITGSEAFHFQLISSFVYEEDKIYQTINVKRQVKSVSEETNFKFMICDKNLNSETVVLDKELNGYFKDSINDNNFINEGDFGYFIKHWNHSLNDFPMIFSIRKALCDFGQYINGILKNGGYVNSNYYCNISNPFFTPLTDNSENSNNHINNKDYLFLSLHGDQPATALNMFLLNVLHVDVVNKFSHTIYALKIDRNNTFQLVNYAGVITKCIATKKRKRDERVGVVGGAGGAGEEYLDDIILYTQKFFVLCAQFKMERKFIEFYNLVYNKYFDNKDINNELVNDTNFKECMDLLIKITDMYNKEYINEYINENIDRLLSRLDANTNANAIINENNNENDNDNDDDDNNNDNNNDDNNDDINNNTNTNTNNNNNNTDYITNGIDLNDNNQKPFMITLTDATDKNTKYGHKEISDTDSNSSNSSSNGSSNYGNNTGGFRKTRKQKFKIIRNKKKTRKQQIKNKNQTKKYKIIKKNRNSLKQK